MTSGGDVISPAAAMRLARRARKIGGWLSPGAICLFAFIDRIQKRLNVGGNLFEIGVHHGKSALVLGAMARPTETLGVCDIFGAQGLNVSASGKGDRDIFMSNYGALYPNDRRLRVFEKLSSGLTVEEISPCRFLHVDGGHSCAEALADLDLCGRCLVPGGIIAVDDAFHPTWPGVTDAIFQFLGRRRDLAPLAVGFNKMLLVSAEWRERYARVFEDTAERDAYIPRQPYSMKIVEVLGHPSYVFYVHSSRSEHSVAARLQRVAMEHPALKNAATLKMWRGLRGVGRAIGVTR